MYWSGGPFSRALLTASNQFKTTIDNAALLVTDLSVDDPLDLVPVLETARQDGLSSIILVLSKLSEKGLNLVLANQTASSQVIPVRLPENNQAEQIAAMEDLAVLTGAQPLLNAAGDTLRVMRFEHLGYARQAWVTREAFGVIGGKGSPQQLRAHIKALRTAHTQTTDPIRQQSLQQRIGKLLGGSATLWIGGATQIETTSIQNIARRTADALRGGLREGVLPGGGTALLACQPALRERLGNASDPDERAAYKILISSLEAPIRTIIANAGYDASAIIAEIRLAGPGYGFDARSGQVVEMAQAGIFDSASVCRAAVQGAGSQAALALTIDVLVHPKNRAANLGAP
jgi:chaperonin GroEL